METVEDSEDTLLKGRSAYYGVVDDDEIVLAGLQAVVGDVVDMAGQVVAGAALGDECAELDVLPRHLLRAHELMKDAAQLVVGRLMVQLLYLAYLLLVAVELEAVEHTIVGHLGGIRDIGEDGVLGVVVHGLKDRLRELPAEFLAFLIYIGVGAAREVDTLEGTGRIAALGEDLLQDDIAVLIDDKGLAGLKLPDVAALQVERGLQHGALAGQHYHLVVLIVERGTDTPRVAHGEHLS